MHVRTLPLSRHTHLTSLPLSQAKTLLSDDYGKDLAGVETLIRRHDELERDLTAIENKLEVLCISLTLIYIQHVPVAMCLVLSYQ